jgi:hypothetical protein
MRKDELEDLLTLPESVIEEALEHLLADARIQAADTQDGVYYSTNHCMIPLGEAAGWEAGFIDHHRAVNAALALKAVNGRHVSAANDTVGGSTLSYDVWPGHPEEQEVLELLATTRRRAVELWDKVEDYNRAHESPAAYQVTFYCGQYAQEDEGGR